MVPREISQETRVEFTQTLAFPLEIPLTLDIWYEELLHGGLEHRADRYSARSSGSTGSWTAE